MPVAMRLMRMGTTHRPVYRISVADSRRAPTGKFIEHIGTFDPHKDKLGNKMLRLNVARAKYWIAMGVQPSKMCTKLLARFHLLPTPPTRQMAVIDPLVLKALAGEDIRPNVWMHSRQAFNPEPSDKPVTEHGVPIHIPPVLARRMKPLTQKQTQRLAKQAPWKLQSFPFDYEPTQATMDAWNQARLFHGYMPKNQYELAEVEEYWEDVDGDNIEKDEDDEDGLTEEEKNAPGFMDDFKMDEEKDAEPIEDEDEGEDDEEYDYSPNPERPYLAEYQDAQGNRLDPMKFPEVAAEMEILKRVAAGGPMYLPSRKISKKSIAQRHALTASSSHTPIASSASSTASASLLDNFLSKARGQSTVKSTGTSTSRLSDKKKRAQNDDEYDEDEADEDGLGRADEVEEEAALPEDPETERVFNAVYDENREIDSEELEQLRADRRMQKLAGMTEEELLLQEEYNEYEEDDREAEEIDSEGEDAETADHADIDVTKEEIEAENKQTQRKK